MNRVNRKKLLFHTFEFSKLSYFFWEETFYVALKMGQKSLCLCIFLKLLAGVIHLLQKVNYTNVQNQQSKFPISRFILLDGGVLVRPRANFIITRHHSRHHNTQKPGEQVRDSKGISKLIASSEIPITIPEADCCWAG